MTSTGPQTVALAVLDLIRSGRFADIQDRFTPNLRPMVAAEALETVWDAEVARLGPVVSTGAPSSDTAAAGVVVVRIPVRFERGELTLLVSVTATGELAGLQLLPADAAQPPVPWEPPPYADPGIFDEQPVVVGEGSLAVPAALTLPKTVRPGPGIVVCGGSGPVDRDGTIAASKPVKDLAWGLASRGVAVLRFDKVTHAHPDQVRADRGFTAADEYLPQALDALRLLRAHPGVAAEDVFLAGHSLGGTLHRAIVRQVRYLASLDPATAAAAQPAVEAMTARADRVDSPDLSPDTPDDQLPFGTPAPYWLDLRGYDPVAAAAALDRPMLLCQGGRDYQVTVADDLSRWRAGLQARADVTIRVYPEDDHFFFPGAGPSSPAELTAPHHVDPRLVVDIADWVSGNGRGVPALS